MTKSLLLPILVLAACSDAPSKEESAQIFAAANTAMTSGQSRAVAEAQNGSALTAPADLVLDFTGACSLGGSVAIAGSYSGSGGTQATFDLTTTFDACHELQGTLDGEVDWTSAASGTSFMASMTGDLDWTGSDGSASCTLDLHLAVSQLGVSYTGSLCGHDVTAGLTLSP